MIFCGKIYLENFFRFFRLMMGNGFTYLRSVVVLEVEVLETNWDFQVTLIEIQVFCMTHFQAFLWEFQFKNFR
jgi:hypothetical protein